MKRILEIHVEKDEDMYFAHTSNPYIVTQATTIKEVIENYAILYEIEINPLFGIDDFVEEE